MFSSEVKGLATGIIGDIAQLFLDAQELVVFRDPVRADSEPVLIWPALVADGEVGDECCPRSRRSDAR